MSHSGLPTSHPHAPHHRRAILVTCTFVLTIIVAIVGCDGSDGGERDSNRADPSLPANATTGGAESRNTPEAGAQSLSPREEGRQIARWQDRCEGEGPIQLIHSPMDPDVIVSVTPLGSLAGAHVTPIDHLYLYPSFESEPDAYPVIMMADGYIKEISRRIRAEGSPDESEEFRLVFQHTCTFFTYFDLVRVLAPDIVAAFPALESGNHAEGHHFVPAGVEIGRIGGQSLDTAVYNTQKPLPGFISPELYESEYWKIYTDDFFQYLPQSAREQLLAKNLRTAEPRSGRIDYDVPGRLIGNWFLEGTNGYAGAPDNPSTSLAADGGGYWIGHLAFVPDVFEPAQLKVSIGEFEGSARQFSVMGNQPHFTDINVATGPVRYELLAEKIYNAPDDPVQAAQNASNAPVLGVILVEVLAGERLRVEVFPRHMAADVDGFTSAARIYER